MQKANRDGGPSQFGLGSSQAVAAVKRKDISSLVDNMLSQLRIEEKNILPPSPL